MTFPIIRGTDQLYVFIVLFSAKRVVLGVK